MLVSCSVRLFEPLYTECLHAEWPNFRRPAVATAARRRRTPRLRPSADQHAHGTALTSRRRRGGRHAAGWLPSTASASRRLGPRRTVLSAPPSIDHDCHRLAAAGRRRTRRDLRDVEVQAAIRHRVVDEPDLHVRQQEGAVGQVVTCKRRQLLSHTAKAR